MRRGGGDGDGDGCSGGVEGGSWRWQLRAAICRRSLLLDGEAGVGDELAGGDGRWG